MQPITFEQFEKIISTQLDATIEELQTSIRYATEDKKELSYVTFCKDRLEHNLYGLRKFVTRLYLDCVLDYTEWSHLINKIYDGIQQLSQLEHEYTDNKLKQEL